MAPFQPKIGSKTQRNRVNKNFHSVPTRRKLLNSKKISKKFKKLKNTIMASFGAKKGWKRPRKRENKNYCSVPFLPDAKLKIPKK